MRRTFLILPTLLVALVVSAFGVGDEREGVFYQRGLISGEEWATFPSRTHDLGFRADTTWFGQYQVIGDQYYAVGFSTKQEGSWTFDRDLGPDGGGNVIPDGEGWTFRDMTTNLRDEANRFPPDGCIDRGVFVWPGLGVDPGK